MNYKKGEEYPIPGEEVYIDKIVSLFRKTLSRYYPSGTTKRVFHPKMHGLVKAEFSVPADLDKSYCVGIFQPGAVYQAWIRLSNAKKHPAPDKKKDMRGMAIKLVGVPGPKLGPGAENAVTHDFVLVTHKTLQTSTVKDFYKALWGLFGGPLKLFLFSITHLPVVIRSIKQISKCSNVLEMSYFSMVPYRFGDPSRAVKYAVFPLDKKTTPFPEKPQDNYLRQQLVKDLTEQDQYFDFMVQFQEDADKMPIEDPTVEWTSPFIKVATIKIPRQTFDSAAQITYGENLSFTPWHCLEAHRPLGGVNRARKKVYEVISALRRERNHTLSAEPDHMISFTTDSFSTTSKK